MTGKLIMILACDPNAALVGQFEAAIKDDKFRYIVYTNQYPRESDILLSQSMRSRLSGYTSAVLVVTDDDDLLPTVSAARMALAHKPCAVVLTPRAFECWTREATRPSATSHYPQAVCLVGERAEFPSAIRVFGTANIVFLERGYSEEHLTVAARRIRGVGPALVC